MIRYLFGFLPLAIFAIGLLSSSLDSEGSLPHYTSDVAVTEDGHLLLANGGINDVRLVDSRGIVQCGWKADAPVTGVTVHGDKAYFTASYDKGYLYGVDIAGDKSSFVFKAEASMGACSPVVSLDG